MDPARSSVEGSESIAGGLEFQEIQCLMTESEPGYRNGSSFTALLGLPANQAMELLHGAEASHAQAISPPAASIWRLHEQDEKPLDEFLLGCFPTFPSNPELVERAARFSVFAAEESCPQTTSSGLSNSGIYLAAAVKAEPADSDSNPNSSAGSKPRHRPAKRKDQDKSKSKARGTSKRTKSSAEDGVAKPAAENDGGEKEKLPYVHVRARRGQATDSHSLAERARREKINARMKLLQELVPGCSKISGTAQVLDEIINHVQSLQRQVEFLSMRLAAVNPRIDDFGGVESFLAASGRPKADDGGGVPGLENQHPWSDAHSRPQRQEPPPQMWLADLLHTPRAQWYTSTPSGLWGRDHNTERHRGLATAATSLLGYDAVNPVRLQSIPLKQEM